MQEIQDVLEKRGYSFDYNYGWFCFSIDDYTSCDFQNCDDCIVAALKDILGEQRV